MQQNGGRRHQNTNDKVRHAEMEIEKQQVDKGKTRERAANAISKCSIRCHLVSLFWLDRRSTITISKWTTLSSSVSPLNSRNLMQVSRRKRKRTRSQERRRRDWQKPLLHHHLTIRPGSRRPMIPPGSPESP